jgi:hypothetical protein
VAVYLATAWTAMTGAIGISIVRVVAGVAGLGCLVGAVVFPTR